MPETENSSSTVTGRLADGTPIRVRTRGARIDSATAIPRSEADDQLILPGLLDIQVNGYAGIDINAEDVTAEDVAALTRVLWKHGVAGFCPTVITASEERITAALRAIAAARDADPWVAASIPGIHVEGPYLSAVDGARGAHDAEQLRDPDQAEFQRWQQACGGLVRIVTVAPERAGALSYIAELAAAGVLVAIGHTAAEPERIRAAALAGARLSTHLGNGAEATLPRHPNHLWAQLAEKRLAASFIADGHHLSSDTLTVMLRAKDVPQSVLVSDSVALAGCAPGEYRTPVGGRVTVGNDGRLTLTGSNLLAGSGRNLRQCVAWLAEYTEHSLDAAVRMASQNPARLLGLGDRGEITAGAPADLTICGPDLSVRATYVRGRSVYRADPGLDQP